MPLTRHLDRQETPSLASAILAIIFQYCTITRFCHLFDNNLNKAKDRLVKIDPPAGDVFLDISFPTATVKPAPVKGL